MKAEFLSDGWRDFHQRYRNTFGWFERKDGHPVLVKLTHIGEVSLEFTDESGFKYSAFADKGNFFTFLPVTKGCYLYDNKVVTVERIPARQWRRGICEDNTAISDILGNYYPIDFQVIKAIFTGQNVSVEQYKEAKKLPVLLNNQFHIEEMGMYLYNRRIGDFGGDTIILNEPLFKQELEDLMKQHQLPIRVVYEAA